MNSFIFLFFYLFFLRSFYVFLFFHFLIIFFTICFYWFSFCKVFFFNTLIYLYFFCFEISRFFLFSISFRPDICLKYTLHIFPTARRWRPLAKSHIFPFFFSFIQVTSIGLVRTNHALLTLVDTNLA